MTAKTARHSAPPSASIAGTLTKLTSAEHISAPSGIAHARIAFTAPDVRVSCSRGVLRMNAAENAMPRSALNAPNTNESQQVSASRSAYGSIAGNTAIAT